MNLRAMSYLSHTITVCGWFCCQKVTFSSSLYIVLAKVTYTNHNFWPLVIQRQHEAPVLPSHLLWAVWGVDTVPSRRPEQFAPQAGCVQWSHSALLWDNFPFAGRKPATNTQINVKTLFLMDCWCHTGHHTSVQRMIFPFSLYSDFWNIFVLLIDSMDFPSMGLITLSGTITYRCFTTDQKWTWSCNTTGLEESLITPSIFCRCLSTVYSCVKIRRELLLNMTVTLYSEWMKHKSFILRLLHELQTRENTHPLFTVLFSSTHCTQTSSWPSDWSSCPQVTV